MIYLPFFEKKLTDLHNRDILFVVTYLFKWQRVALLIKNDEKERKGL